jgi:hypothetical protein
MLGMQLHHHHCSKSASDGLAGKPMLHTFKNISGVVAVACCTNLLSSHQHAKKMHVQAAYSGCQGLVSARPTLQPKPCVLILA